MNGELTLTVEPDDRESAEGYILRCCSTNRVTPMQLHRWLELSWRRELRPEHLPALAEATRVPLPWLRARTPVRTDLRRSWDYGGWRWRAAQAIHRGHQRLCPLCVHRNGLMKMEWTLEFMAVCPRHRCLLIDHCGHCGREIRWQRPAVDVCACGRHFKGEEGDGGLRLSEDLEYWLQWVVESLRWRGGRPAPLLGGLAELWPGEPSPDGVWRLLRAFGVCRSAMDRSYAELTTTEASAPRSTLGVLERGFSRIRRLLTSGEVDDVNLSELKRQASLGITAADRELAAAYVARIAKRSLAGAHEQMELFA